MAPSASILFPTHARRDYLAVALRSVAGQAAAHGAEIVVVEDGPAERETERLVGGHGGRYVALGEARGINAARNAAVEAASADLLCFLDDDVEAWPGWLAALLEGARRNPDHEALGGPIRARLEGTNLRACGREPLPVTNLDLGPADVDAGFVWGSNLAIRRAALARIGPFDEGLGGAGDEEDWQLRLRAAGGRVRYVAAAGVDHRRAGADARIAALSRAHYHRGRHARRWDTRKGTSPPVVGELRTLAGCVWHTGRYRCGNGIVLTAHTLGRLREAVAPSPPLMSALEPDWASGDSGRLSRRTAAMAAVRDAAADLAALPSRVRLARVAQGCAVRRVLVLGVARREHATAAARTARALERSRHDVDVRFAPPAPGAGKWANLNAALEAAVADATDPAGGATGGAGADPPEPAPAGVGAYDWLLIVDDDVVLPRGFLDTFLLLAERHGLVLAQPAHAFRSHAAWRVTRRQPGVAARRTRFVEIGPVTAIRAEAFPVLLPFPDLRMGWGLDAHWSAVAAERGWPIGVVDATPLRHTRPVADAYPRGEAVAEAEAFLRTRPYVPRDEAQRTLAVYRDRR
jgi:GT2 family glycosyltransferase